MVGTLFTVGGGDIAMSNDSLIAEITISHPELVLTPTIRSRPSASIELENRTIASTDGCFLFFRVEADDFDAFDAAVTDDETVSDNTVIIETERFRVYRMRLASIEQPILDRAAEMGIRLLRASSGENSWLAAIESPDRSTLRSMREFCDRRNVTFSIDRLYHPNRASDSTAYGLTPIQHETLRTARAAGYFSEPRQASIDDLATMLEVSPAAVSGRLRRGMDRLVSNTIAESPERGRRFKR